MAYGVRPEDITGKLESFTRLQADTNTFLPASLTFVFPFAFLNTVLLPKCRNIMFGAAIFL